MKRSDDAIVVTAMGAITPVGASAIQTGGALRAGLPRIGEHAYFVPAAPDPPLIQPDRARAASVRDVPPAATLEQRLMFLALSPIREVVTTTGLRRAQLQQAAIYLSLPATAGGRPVPDGRAFRDAWLDLLNLRPARAPSFRQEGTTGMLTDAADAAARLSRGEMAMAVLLGVDSYLDHPSLVWLDGAHRLKSERSPDGLVPGEAGVALLLETDAGARARGAVPLARLAAFGSGRESRTVLSDRYATGTGLAEAIAAALREGPARAPLWPIADLNGESHRAQEWGVVQARLAAQLGSAIDVWHPADCVGDVGAAAGGLQVALACHAFWRGNAPAQRALVFCAADGGERAACLLVPAGAASS